MAIEQIAFFIPPDIQQGIDAGLFVRCGGVIRNTKGRIIKHLKELDKLPTPQKDGGLTKVVNFLSKHKVAVGIGVVAITATATGILYTVFKDRKNKEIEIPKCIADFNDALSLYFNSINSSNISEEVIDQLIVALDKVKRECENGNIDLILSIENIDLLVDTVKKYTIKFAQANSFDLSKENTIDNDDKIINLWNYLNIQKQVFKKSS